MTGTGLHARVEPGAAKPSRHSYRWTFIVATAGVVAAVVATVLLLPGHDWPDGTRHGRWLAVFDGFGATTSAGSGAKQAITLSPKRTRGKEETHAALVVTTARYRDFVVTARVRTEQQLREGAAGPPNPWEVGWFVWHYQSNREFYALTLGPSGWALSKQDPHYPGGQRFLATGNSPKFVVGKTHTAGVVQVGRRITVSGDGRMLTNFTDTERPYDRGAFGLYAEDSTSIFDRIKISPLPDSH